jgi:cysteine desulfurase
MTIRPSSLFRKQIIDFQVDTSNGQTRYINLDNAATTPPLRCVEESVTHFINSYGSVHRGSGYKSKVSTSLYEQSREIIKHFVHAPDDSYVLLTGNTTGAMNTAAYFFAQIRGKVMVSDIEHSSSWLPWIKSEGNKRLGKTQYCLDEMDQVNDKIQSLGLSQVLCYRSDKDFKFDLDDIERQLKRCRIKILVLTASSNLTGYCPDIAKVGKLAHQYGAYFLVDACQFLQHHPLDMQKMGIDFLVASGHKFYAPYGGGFLIGPKAFLDKFLPYQIGGGNLPYIQSDGYFIRYQNQLAHDPGTPNALGAVSMAVALQKLSSIGVENIEAYEKRLSDYVYDQLSVIPKVTLYVKKSFLSSIITFNIDGFTAQQTADTLNNEYGIGTRAGNFCVYHVVRKLLNVQNEETLVQLVKSGHPELLLGVVRASFGLCNTMSDAKTFVHAVKELSERATK